MWATPVTMGAFVLLAVTGVLMFFHLDSGINKEVHEWLGWALVVGGLLHAVVHFGSVKRHLLRWQGAAVVGIFVAVLAGSFFISGEQGGGSPVKAVVMRLTEVPLEALAPAAGLQADEVVARVREAGYAQASVGMSLAQITGERGKAMAVLGMVMNRP